MKWNIEFNEIPFYVYWKYADTVDKIDNNFYPGWNVIISGIPIELSRYVTFIYISRVDILMVLRDHCCNYNWVRSFYSYSLNNWFTSLKVISFNGITIRKKKSHLITWRYSNEIQSIFLRVCIDTLVRYFNDLLKFLRSNVHLQYRVSADVIIILLFVLTVIPWRGIR